MKEVSIYITTDIRGRWEKNGSIAYTLEYYRESSLMPDLIEEVAPVQQMNENRAELEALIQALKRMREKCVLTIYTENRYLYEGYEEAERVKAWKQNGWRRADGKEIKNRDKWEELEQILKGNLFTILLKEPNAYIERMKERMRRN